LIFPAKRGRGRPHRQFFTRLTPRSDIFSSHERGNAMAEPLKNFPQGPVKPAAVIWKYPSEDETYIRRLGSAALSLWAGLPPEIQAKLLTEASQVWDREHNVANLPAKLEAFVK